MLLNRLHRFTFNLLKLRWGYAMSGSTIFRRGLSLRLPALLAVLMLSGMITASLAGHSNFHQNDPPQALPLRAGFPSYAFAGMEANYAKNTASIYLQMLTEGLGMAFSSRIYPDRASLKQDVANQRLDFVMVSSVDLLGGQLVPDFQPVLAPLTGGEPGQKFLLLVHQHAGLQSIAELGNRHLLVFSDSEAGLEDIWLDRELARRNLPAGKEFFRLIERPLSAPRTVLPVFFRRADACIISASLLDQIASSNPQIKTRLVPLAESERFLATVLCLRQDYPAAARKKLVEAAEQISQHPEFRPLLSMAKVGQVSRFREPMLDTVRALLTDQSLRPPVMPINPVSLAGPGPALPAPPASQAATGMPEQPGLSPDATD